LRDWLAAVQKAVALDPYDGEAHMVLGYAYRMLFGQTRAHGFGKPLAALYLSTVTLKRTS
jgi:hypothetical protein